jgi:hypothetical protein
MTALPAPVARFRSLLADEPTAETAVIETTCWMRRPRMPRIPLTISMAHRLGEAFVHDIRIGRGRLSFRFGLDAFVDGLGVIRIGPAVSRGPHYDDGALIAMWGEAVWFPSAWEGRDDVRWDAIDGESAVLVIRRPSGDLPLTVTFDSATGLPTACTADRYKGDGPKVGWTGRSTAWRRVDGVLVPTRLTAQWADEPLPWIDITTRHVRINVPVDDALARGRALLSPQRRGNHDQLPDQAGGSAPPSTEVRR